jgi:hypothetical protein
MSTAQSHDLRKAWTAVRRDFFPRWDRHNIWRLVISRLPGICHGQCQAEKHRIVIQIVPSDADERDALLIHETCHAFSPSHGKLWQARMGKAAERAKQQKRLRLAELLQEEIRGYQQFSPGDERRNLYRTISDWLLEDPKLSYRNVRRVLARECGLKPADFDCHFPRAKKVFAKAKRDGQQVLRVKFVL